jgi:transcriptional regulator with XRE-family HTH domain
VYLHPVVHNAEPIGTLPTPEELAGHELRRLRQVRGWSQEEVARRMAEYGYDWHQTTVGRTETATRPLRLNEAVALAGLFEIPVTRLIAPPNVVDADKLTAQMHATEVRLLEAKAACADARNRAAMAAEAAKAASYAAAEADADVDRRTQELGRLTSMRELLERELGQ